MAFLPIAYVSPQYENFPNYWMKAFEQGTVNPKVMAIDPSGSPTVAKLQLDSRGFPITVGLALAIPYVDGSYDMWLFPTDTEADANDTANAIQIADNITGPTFTSGNTFAGADPTLANNTSAINWGAADTVNDPHIASGPTLIQAKATELTVAQLNLNTLGGTVQTGPSADHHTKLTGDGFEVRDDSNNVVHTSSFGTFDCNHPDDTPGVVRRVLNIRDKFSQYEARSGATLFVASGDIGNLTEMQTASVTLDLATGAGWADNDEAYYYFTNATGGTLSASGSMSIAFNPGPVPQGKVFSLKKITGNNFLYVGP